MNYITFIRYYYSCASPTISRHDTYRDTGVTIQYVSRYS